MGKNNFFYESANAKSEGHEVSATFGAYNVGNPAECQSFEERFNELQSNYKANKNIDIRRDIERMVSDPLFMESYKEDLLKPAFNAFREACPNDPHIESKIKNLDVAWDTKVKMWNESANVMGFLPIATLEFPVLLKQYFQSIMNDIIDVEAVKTPNISKHYRTTYMVDNTTGQEYEYPKCLFDGTWQKIWEAQKGHKIKNTVVPLKDGRIYKFDIIKNLTDGIPGQDKLSMQFKIVAVQVGDELVTLKGNGITVEFATNGTFVNGDLSFTTPKGTDVEDTLGGKVDFKNGTVDLSSASGQVSGVVFEGYLSNESNMRHASIREKRDILRFTIEDGARWNMPFSIEEIEDAAALLDMNYYNRMVDEIVKCQEMQEGMTVIKFLSTEFDKYNGVNTDIYKLESMAKLHMVDIKAPQYYAGNPFEYITKAIQYRLRAVMHQLTEATKMEGLSFIIVGNPMATQLLSEFTTWKMQQGTQIGGLAVNNGYGFATDLGANVRVVATNLYDAYTKDEVEQPKKNPGDANEVPKKQRELVLHIYAYPTDGEHITFRHLKYTSHLLTSQSQSAYQSPTAQGGAYNIVTAMSRFKDISVQGIQARLVILNSDLVYGAAPAAIPVTGGPNWER